MKAPNFNSHDFDSVSPGADFILFNTQAAGYPAKCSKPVAWILSASLRFCRPVFDNNIDFILVKYGITSSHFNMQVVTQTVLIRGMPLCLCLYMYA